MRLKQRLPEGRTLEQVINHYQAEKAIALRLKNSTREERKSLFPHVYAELFQKVPDHPRLRRGEDIEKAYALSQKKFQWVKYFLDRSTVFVEFGSGDCHFASTVAAKVKAVYAIDIYDQRSPSFKAPDNFHLILTDGFDLDFKENSADVVFSDQLIEHLHPEDVELHFALAKSILRQGGFYILKTPHAFFGPHDVSKFFSDEPEGLHLKEWTFVEIFKMLKKLNFSASFGYWKVLKGVNHRYIQTPELYFVLVERMLGNLPKKAQRLLSKLFLPRHAVVVAVK